MASSQSDMADLGNFCKPKAFERLMSFTNPRHLRVPNYSDGYNRIVNRSLDFVQFSKMVRDASKGVLNGYPPTFKEVEALWMQTLIKFFRAGAAIRSFKAGSPEDKKQKDLLRLAAQQRLSSASIAYWNGLKEEFPDLDITRIYDDDDDDEDCFYGNMRRDERGDPIQGSKEAIEMEDTLLEMGDDLDGLQMDEDLDAMDLS